MRGGGEKTIAQQNLYDSSRFGSFIDSKYALAKTLIRSFTICKDTAGEEIHMCMYIYTSYVSASRSSFSRLAEAVCSMRQLAPGQVTVSGELEAFSRHKTYFSSLGKSNEG